MNYIYQNGRTESGEYDRSALEQLLGDLDSGDCLVVARLSCIVDSSAALLELLEELQSRGIRLRSVEEGLDTGNPESAQALELLKAVLRLDAGQRPREDSPAKGRKPIEVDEEIFDQILQRWKSGEITARQAMAELNLKPNTFYRRVKERENKGGADALLDAAKKLGKDIVSTVAEGGKGLQQAAGKLASSYDLSALSDAARKNISAAGKAFTSRMDSLSRDFQEAMQRYEKKSEEQAAEAEAQEQPMDAPVTEIPETETCHCAETQECPEATEPIEAQECPEAAEPIEAQEQPEAAEPIEAQECPETAEPAEAQENPEPVEAQENPEPVEAQGQSETAETPEGFDPLEMPDAPEAPQPPEYL